MTLDKLIRKRIHINSNLFNDLKLQQKDNKLYYNAFNIKPSAFKYSNGNNQKATISFISKETLNINSEFIICINSDPNYLVHINNQRCFTFNIILVEGINSIDFSLNFFNNPTEYKIFSVVFNTVNSKLYEFQCSIKPT